MFLSSLNPLKRGVDPLRTKCVWGSYAPECSGVAGESGNCCPSIIFYRPLLYSYPTQRRSGALTRFTTNVFGVVAHRSVPALPGRAGIVVPLLFFTGHYYTAIQPNVEAGH